MKILIKRFEALPVGTELVTAVPINRCLLGQPQTKTSDRLSGAKVEVPIWGFLGHLPFRVLALHFR
jgi:hypothetical protein